MIDLNFMQQLIGRTDTAGVGGGLTCFGVKCKF